MRRGLSFLTVVEARPTLIVIPAEAQCCPGAI